MMGSWEANGVGRQEGCVAWLTIEVKMSKASWRTM